MREYLIKRYLLEKAYNDRIYQKGISDIKFQNDLYEEFKSGHIILDEREFDVWLHRLKENKRNFGRCLKMEGYLKSDENITEITEDGQYSSIKDACVGNGNPKQIIAMFGDDYCSKPQTEMFRQPTHLIVNGVYDNLKIYLTYISKRSIASSFSIGYLGQNTLKDNYTVRVINYYKRLKEFLEKYSVFKNLSVIDEQILTDTHVYVLNYNIKPNKPKDKDVITHFSDR